ncbi:hypothetical protein [Plesiomonas shigelloides]|uniref:hypothetical protein n=1 Tax=Plesiomonas shigelloides TaxID=703 RepID=UPI00224676B3|nr:hypothetical protein [Plesiomonas shigelloides]MCX2499448.1 hypothetical protein [Plesiomonas shigelloides]
MDDKKTQKSIIIDVSAQKNAHVNRSFQMPLFPIEIIETYPNNQGSADLTLIGKGRDGKHYAIKTIRDNGGYVPASEFFCYSLARLVSIPTPAFDSVQLTPGDIAFGSVWEGGVTTIRTDIELFKILNGQVVIDDLNVFFGKVYGFDLFINNEVRHFGNYIFRDSFNNSKIALAFDFSRAWKVTDPFGYQCLEKTSNTVACNEVIRKFGKFDRDAAIAVLDEIKVISKESIVQIFSLMHDSWFSNDDQAIILEWWGSREFVERIERLKRAI